MFDQTTRTTGPEPAGRNCIIKTIINELVLSDEYRGVSRNDSVALTYSKSQGLP
jgi:hypothetical protein